jgi:hypothetical protein
MCSSGDIFVGPGESGPQVGDGLFWVDGGAGEQHLRL